MATDIPPGARLLVLARRSVSEGGRLSWCTSGRHPAAGGPSRTPRVASQRCLCRRHRRRQPVLCRHDDRCGHRLHTPTHVRSPHRLLYRRHPYGHNVIRQCASCLEFDARTASLRDRARSDRPAILTSLLGTDRVAPRCADPTLIPSSILWVPGSVSRSLISAFTGAQPRGHGSQAAKHDR